MTGYLENPNIVGCRFCDNARINDALSDDNDYSSMCVDCHGKNRVMIMAMYKI